MEQALSLGYRYIDTAAAYNNEDAVGKALANSPTPREQIHVTTNVWWDQLQPDAMHHSMDRSLKALRSEYVDLFCSIGQPPIGICAHPRNPGVAQGARPGAQHWRGEITKTEP